MRTRTLTRSLLWLSIAGTSWRLFRRRGSAGLVLLVLLLGFLRLRDASSSVLSDVPAAALLRRSPLRRLVKQTDEEVGNTSAFVSHVMTRVSSAERRVALRRSVPFGLSILLVGRRSH